MADLLDFLIFLIIFRQQEEKMTLPSFLVLNVVPGTLVPEVSFKPPSPSVPVWSNENFTHASENPLRKTRENERNTARDKERQGWSPGDSSVNWASPAGARAVAILAFLLLATFPSTFGLGRLWLVRHIRLNTRRRRRTRRTRRPLHLGHCLSPLPPTRTQKSSTMHNKTKFGYWWKRSG